MKSVNAYLGFDGDCRQAVAFYQQCLGAELTVNRYPDATGQPSTDPAARVMHAQLMLNGAAILMASDTPQPGTLTPGNHFSVAIDCQTVTEVERLFASLSQSGVVRMPLTEAPWGAMFGMLTDQFEIQWVFNCNLTTKLGGA